MRTAGSVILGATFVLTSCVSVNPTAGFLEVSKLADERTGLRVRWDQGAAEDEAAKKAVRQLLARELGPADAMQVALLNNRRLQALYESLGVAQADLVQAGLLRNPVLDAQFRFHDSGLGAEAEVVQDFMSVFFIPLRKRIAAAAFEATKLEVTGQILDLAAEVRSAYYDFQAAEQLVEMRTSVLAATGASSDLARRLYEAGNIVDIERDNERALYEQAKIDLAAAEAQGLAARERLNGLMGLWGKDTAWAIPARLPALPASEPSLERVESRAVEASLDLAAEKARLDSLAGLLGLARPFALFPEANLGGSGEKDSESGWGFGPALGFPLPFFDQGQAAVAAARAELHRGHDRLAALAVELRAEARAARNAVLATRNQVEHYADVLLPLRHRIVGETQKQYNAMLVGTFQLLLAKQQEIEAASRSITALRDYWLARTALDQLLGGRMPRRGRPPDERAAAEGGREGDGRRSNNRGGR